jgi:hypothetical protein
MISWRRFLIVSLFSALAMKIVGEVIHEVLGHGFLILLFGGRIVSLHISILWPYELSYIAWTGTFTSQQSAWIAGGGILACLIISSILQISLLLNLAKDWRASTPFLWLAFWTAINPAGYLIISGVRPFGDIASLIADDVLTQQSSLLIGLIIFLIAFLSLSKNLTTILSTNGIVKDTSQTRLSLVLFWVTIPIITAITCLGMWLPLDHLQIFIILSLLPLPAAALVPNFL